MAKGRLTAVVKTPKILVAECIQVVILTHITSSMGGQGSPPHSPSGTHILFTLWLCYKSSETSLFSWRKNVRIKPRGFYQLDIEVTYIIFVQISLARTQFFFFFFFFFLRNTYFILATRHVGP